MRQWDQGTRIEWMEGQREGKLARRRRVRKQLAAHQQVVNLEGISRVQEVIRQERSGWVQRSAQLPLWTPSWPSWEGRDGHVRILQRMPRQQQEILLRRCRWTRLRRSC